MSGLRILLVDDEPMILDALERMLRRARPGCDVLTANDGPSAVRIVADRPVDLVVADLDLPGMDGIAILNEVRDLRPETVRFILSGCEDPRIRLRTAPVAHRFLAKPCELRALTAALDDADRLRTLTPTVNVRRAIAGLDSLPAAPHVFASLTAALGNPDCSMAEVAAIISRDDALTGKVLQVVNSAFFGMPQATTSVIQAVSFLGLNALKSLVLSVEAFRVFSASERCAGFSIDDHKVHAILTARIAHGLVDRSDRDDAFAAGLLHDLGKLALADQMCDEYSAILATAGSFGPELVEHERSAFGTDHAALGGALLRVWGLPGRVCAIVEHHDAPVQTDDRIDVASAVRLANRFAHRAAVRAGIQLPPADESLIDRPNHTDADTIETIAADEASRIAVALASGSLL